MATKKFIIEVEEGETKCKYCPINGSPYCTEVAATTITIKCYKYNLATIKIKELEE